MIDNIKLYNKDCLDLLRTINECTIDCVIIDEPYGILKGHIIEQNYNIDIALQVRKEIYRILKKDGWFIFFSQFPVAWDFGRITFEAGFSPFQECNEMIWCKRSNSNPFMKIARIHENIFVFKKGNPKIYENKAPFEDIVVDNAFHGISSFENIKRRLSEMAKYYRTGKKLKHKKSQSYVYDDVYKNFNTLDECVVMNSEIRLPSIFSFLIDGKRNRLSEKSRLSGEFKNTKTSSAHVTQKPILLLRRLIKLFTKENDLILDCFSGSGTTAMACLQEGRNFIGCELNEIYFNNSIQRLKDWKIDLQEQDKWLDDRGVNNFKSDIIYNNSLFI